MMDHFELGRVAYEARQFVDAESHLSRVEEKLSDDKNLLWHKMRYELAKMFREETCWLELESYSRALISQNKFLETMQLFEMCSKGINPKHLAFVHEITALVNFKNGALSISRRHAVQHINLLIEKKVTHKIIEFSNLYQHWFPRSLYFFYTKIQAQVLQEDVQGLEMEFQNIYEQITRKWLKLEDNHNASKQDLLLTANDIIKALDMTNGEAVLLSHYAHLVLLKTQEEELKKEDWKKLIEIIVQDASWKKLKLALEIGISKNEFEIALETYAQIKKKKSYSFVKLTKHDHSLKAWLLENGGAKPYRQTAEEQKINITAEDLKLEDETTDLINENEFEYEETEDIKSIEINAIKQLSLHKPGQELYPDLVVTYKTLKFQRVVNWLLENFNYQDASMPLRKKMQYFKVLHAMEIHQNFMALAIIEEMLGDTSLTLEEFKELKYAEGNLLLKVGRKRNAKDSFSEVLRLDPDYRQVKERMQRIASN